MSFNRTPKYIPPSNAEIPADSDIVVLGRWIEDPTNPEIAIASSLVIPPTKIYEGQKIDCEVLIQQVQGSGSGIWAKCLELVAGQLSFHRAKSRIEDLKFESLETKYFIPDDNYLTKAIKDLGVQAHLENHYWKKPVYMIIGVKIGRNPQGKIEMGGDFGIKAELKPDLTALGIPIKIGPEIYNSSKKQIGTKYRQSTDIVFAYRLLKVSRKKNGQGYHHSDYLKGALFGKDDEDCEPEEGQNLGLWDLYEFEFDVDIDVDEEVDYETWE